MLRVIEMGTGETMIEGRLTRPWACRTRRPSGRLDRQGHDDVIRLAAPACRQASQERESVADRQTLDDVVLVWWIGRIVDKQRQVRGSGQTGAPGRQMEIHRRTLGLARVPLDLDEDPGEAAGALASATRAGGPGRRSVERGSHLCPRL